VVCTTQSMRVLVVDTFSTQNVLFQINLHGHMTYHMTSLVDIICSK